MEGNTLRLECELHSHRMPEIAWTMMAKDLCFSKCLLLIQPTPKSRITNSPTWNVKVKPEMKRTVPNRSTSQKLRCCSGKPRLGDNNKTRYPSEKKLLSNGIAKNLNKIYFLPFKT